MSDLEGIKSYLYSYLQSKKRISPEYTFIQKNIGRGRSRFICEVRADSYDYVGIGNSTNKKDAQTNAARDFVNYLVRNNEVDASTVPAAQPSDVSNDANSSQDVRYNPPQMLPPSGTELSGNGPHTNYITSIFDQKKLEEAEEVDLTADLHGGWSMENAKARLNEYLQATRQQVGQVKYTAMGPDHHRSYVAEMTVHAKKLKKSLYAREAGSNKQMASRACCLSLVRQLFHAGEIEAFTGEKRKKKHAEVPPQTVQLNPAIESQLADLLDRLGLSVNLKPPENLSPEQSHNMVVNYNLVDFDDAPKQQPQSVSWCPPLQNWHPWTACNIDDGPESSMPLSQISRKLGEEHMYRLNHEPHLKSLREERSHLPVFTYRQGILESIKHNQVTLIRGETGCGKTTQIPQFVLDSYLECGLGAECSVLVTQPRRISAISLAERIAYERGEVVGSSVGYSVRFETVYPRPYGSILFCTVGAMARKMEGGLRGVSHIIVDEIHERDVNTDFMLILLRDMVHLNKDLRLVLMSATIDITMFMNYFGDCTVLDIEGRTHPVEYYFLEDCIKMLNYVPPPPDEKKLKRRQEAQSTQEDADENCNLKCGPAYGDAVARSMREIIEKEVPLDLVCAILDRIVAMNISGAVLIFLPGWNIISLLRKYLQSHRRYGGPDYLILPLHSQMPREEQRLVFRPTPTGVRKIVLSTNIAESSITINDVVFVIDFCLSRSKLFTARNNLTSYSTSWASKTNLEQRRGRAGRVRPGFAFHLCSRARFERLDQHATPEILRTPLHELALLIKLLRLGSVGDFLKKALQPPPLDAVIEAEFTLRAMKALDKNDELTPLGMILARLPVDPHLGKMLILACAFGLGGAAAILTASSSLGCDPFLISPERRRLSNHQRSFAAGYASDHLAGLNVYQVWATERARHGPDATESFCEQHEFNNSALRVIDDAGNQLRSILINLGFPEISLSDSPVNFNLTHNVDCDVLTSLLTTGLYPNVCFHSDKRKLFTIEGTLALVHKSSVNCSNFGTKFTFPFFVFDEKIRTQAVSCKNLTMVNPIQLMLFGCRTATWRQDSGDSGLGTVMVDDWIPFQMNYTTAARIFAFRPVLEALLVRACIHPEEIGSVDGDDNHVIELVRKLCDFNALDPHSQLATDSDNTHSPPKKRFAIDTAHPLLSGRMRRNIDDPNVDRRAFEKYANYPERMNYRNQYSHANPTPASHPGNIWQDTTEGNNYRYPVNYGGMQQQLPYDDTPAYGNSWGAPSNAYQNQYQYQGYNNQRNYAAPRLNRGGRY